jgi:hypothetical protein
MRALSWAVEKQEKTPEEISRPSVIGAFAYPGHCLNLTDFGALDELRVAYEKARLLVESQGGKLPVNGKEENGEQEGLFCLFCRVDPQYSSKG